MTEDERTALIQQINRNVNLTDHQMRAVLGALHHLKWEQKMGQTETARCEPPEGTKNGTYHVHDDGDTQRVCKWANQRWYNCSGENSKTAGEAADQGWRYSHAVPMEPPVPDPHAALRDAVVEAAMSAYYNGWLPRHIDEVSKSCAALAAAQTPPDPAKELADAWDAIQSAMPADAEGRMNTAVARAIAALEQGNAA